MIDIRERHAAALIFMESIVRIEDYLISKQRIFFEEKKEIAESRRCSTA
jgi:hypothetical protein